MQLARIARRRLRGSEPVPEHPRFSEMEQWVGETAPIEMAGRQPTRGVSIFWTLTVAAPQTRHRIRDISN